MLILDRKAIIRCIDSLWFERESHSLLEISGVVTDGVLHRRKI